MYIFYLDTVAETASFRVPETHTYHETLPLPPRTTLIGMAGAALGLPYEEAYKFINDIPIYVGVSGSSLSIFKDLWNYRKITNKSYTNEQIKDRQHYSIVIREYLYQLSSRLYFGCEKCEELEKIKTAFSSPVYPITAGNSDDLLKIKKISSIQEFSKEEVSEFSNTCIPGDISSLYRPVIKITDTPITQTVFDPRIYRLPFSFTFEGNKRIVSEKRIFSFIQTPIRLKSSIFAFLIEGQPVAML